MSLRSVRRSFKDYTIYFLTLTFAVCIFYSFNSISSQQAMTEISSSKASIMDMLSKVISVTSVFVSIILAFLIIYANNFLIKRRKKEIGLYMTLGMSKRKISSLLIYETFFIGVISLVVGLLSGVFVSQGLSLFTTKMFDINVSKYNFVFSSEAAIKTAMYFGIIFLIVMIFNTFAISKYKLIDLLTAGKKNEKIKIKNTRVAFLLFVASLIIIGSAYTIILKNGLTGSAQPVYIAVILGILGTLIFFMSLAGFLINILQKNKSFYLKNLNMFVLRQINSKVNTTYISMAVIALMLFLTTTLLSTGVSFKNSLQGDLENVTPFDVTLYSFNDDDKAANIEKSLEKVGYDYKNSFKDYMTFNSYKGSNGVKKYIYDYSNKNVKSALNDYDSSFDIISLSDFNKLRIMAGDEVITPQKDEVIILSNVNNFYQAVDEFLKNNDKINIEGNEFRIYNKKSLRDNLKTDAIQSIFMAAVVPDEFVKNLPVSTTYLNGNFSGDSEEKEKDISKIKNDFMNGKYSYDEYGIILGMTKSEVYLFKTGMSITVLYIVIYLGIIFLITSAAILAIQQLSEASDNVERYAVLKKIGVSSKMINKSIFVQVLIYFMMPLVLGLVHSLVGIKVASDTISIFGSTSILTSSLITAGVIAVIYGGYFVATYFGYKNIVKNK